MFICDYFNSNFATGMLTGVLSGLLTGAIVAIATYYIVNAKTRKDLREKYGKAAGKYEGYALEGNKTISNNPQSHAEIVYLQDNLLSLKLQHDGLVWEGQISMESENYGAIAWRYTIIPKTDGKESQWFGLKKCIVRNNIGEDKVFVYLIGEESEGYGKEILIRNR